VTTVAEEEAKLVEDVPRAVTMHDIARVAGVSQSTVSRVLNGTKTSVPIASSTKERVLEVARSLSYRPNPLARGLRGAKTMLLGVIAREIADPFFATAVDALTFQAMERGYNVVLGSAHSRADEAMLLRAVLETRHCDAILVLGDMRDQPKLIDDLRASNTPVVALWQGPNLEGVPTINIDNRAGIFAAVDHLAALGHRRFGFIGGHKLGDIRQRKDAFTERLTELGLPSPADYITHVNNDAEGGHDALRSLMDLAEPPTAIVAATDHLASGVLNAAHMLGINVPGRLSVVGFDDIPLAAYTVPPLTTLHMPISEMTELAVQVAIDRTTPHDHVLTPTLVVRHSTGPAPV
jgi:DNA-binding LacI/PurR family transcriptional regulator